MKLTDDEKMKYIKDLDKYTNRLVKKFEYYTKMEIEDLQQEAAFKILEILKKYEEGTITCKSRHELLKFINKSLLHHMIRLIRDFPSYTVIENNIDNLYEELPHVRDDCSHIDVEEILEHPDLDEVDTDIVYLLIHGYTQKEIADIVDLKQSTVSYRISTKIRKVIPNGDV